MTVLAIATSIAALCHAQQTANTPPQELLRYVHEAKQNGVKDDKIKQQAMVVGWPAAMVDQAIAYEKSGKAVPGSPATPAATETPAKAQPAPAEVPATAPADAPVNGAETVARAGGSSTNLAVPEDYQVAAGDTLQVSVWNHAEVSVPSEIVRPDGKISVPLIKDVVVAGLTPRQVEKAVTDQLAKFYTDANVTVVVVAIGAKKVYLTGGIKKEGPVPFTNGMTVMQAISEAGGLTDYAKRKKIYILRTENGREYRLDFNYDEVIKGVRMEQNYPLLPGDTIVVPN